MATHEANDTRSLVNSKEEYLGVDEKFPNLHYKNKIKSII